jgi:hypothetical protein
MAASPSQPYFCGRGSINQTRCTAEAAGWGVCRSSAFSDGCLLVGKYSTAGAAAVPQASSRPSSEDGRQAACYSTPQLQRMQLMERGSSSRSRPPALLPLLGGSYSAGRSDICYNLVAPKPEPQSTVVWIDGHGQIPEDVGKTPTRQPAAGSSSSSRPSGRSGGAPARDQQQKPPQQQQQQQRGQSSARVSAYGRYSYMDRTEAVQLQQGSAAAAACVRVEPTVAATAGSTSAAAGRHLLTMSQHLLTGSSSSSSGEHSHNRKLAGAQAASSATGGTSAAALLRAASVQAALSAQGASLLASLASSSSSSAACTASPVLCFSSNCDRQGRLWIGASLPGGRRVSFACPSRSVVDLSRALPGAYLLGFLQCPSNALVCESMGCGQCSASGGYCSRGRCYCHMERYGKGCSQSLVPRLG